MLVSGSLDLHAKQWFSERVTKPRMRTYTTYIYNYIYIIRTRRKTIARSDPAPARQRPPHAPLTVILINRKNNTPSHDCKWGADGSKRWWSCERRISNEISSCGETSCGEPQLKRQRGVHALSDPQAFCVLCRAVVCHRVVMVVEWREIASVGSARLTGLIKHWLSVPSSWIERTGGWQDEPATILCQFGVFSKFCVRGK